MLAAFGWTGTALLAILLAAMVVAAWEHLERQAEQHRRRSVWNPAADEHAGEASAQSADGAVRSVAITRALSHAGQSLAAGRRADPTWIETRPMINLGLPPLAADEPHSNVEQRTDSSALDEVTEVDLILG